MESNNDKPLYGIWIPNVGWLRGKDVFADTNIDKANQVAGLIGNGARVRFIDSSIVDLEQKYLESERKKWRIFKNLFARKTNI